MLRRQALLLGLSTAFAAAFPSLALDRPLTPEEQQLIAEVSAHNSAIRSMAGRFLQVDSQGNRSQGTFYLQRPDRVRFRYDPPSRQEIISVGRGFYILDRKEETSTAYPQDTVPLRQFLGDTIDLFRANIVDVVAATDYLSVTITDTTIAGTVEVTLIFDVATKDLAQWSLVEPNGTELTFSLFDVQKDVDIPSGDCDIDPSYRSVDRR
jgi:outer membrane lipoprotein-sorting protein